MEQFEINGKKTSMCAAVSAINSGHFQTTICQIVMDMIQRGETLTLKDIFVESVLFCVEARLKPSREEKQQIEPIVRKASETYFSRRKARLRNFRHEYQDYLLMLLEAPFIIEAEHDGKMRYCHIASTKSFQEAFKRVRGDSHCYNEYAMRGFINVLRRYLDSERKPYASLIPFLVELTDEKRGEMVSDSELVGILDFYIDNFSFIRRGWYREAVLFEIAQLCRVSQRNRNIFLMLYESRQELFDWLFGLYPEYTFVTRGKHEYYETASDFLIKLGIGSFMLEEDNISRPELSKMMHRIKIIRAVDIITERARQKHKNYQICNIWPNSTLSEDDVSSVGPYIAIALRKHRKWILLVDNIDTCSSFYVWDGEKLADGMMAFEKNQSRLNFQPEIRRIDHAGENEDYVMAYMEAFFETV